MHAPRNARVSRFLSPRDLRRDCYIIASRCKFLRSPASSGNVHVSPMDFANIATCLFSFPIEVCVWYVCAMRTRARSSPLTADIRYINSGVRAGEGDKSWRTDHRRRLMTPWDAVRRDVSFSFRTWWDAREKKLQAQRVAYVTGSRGWMESALVHQHALTRHMDRHTDTDGHRCVYVSRCLTPCATLRHNRPLTGGH